MNHGIELNCDYGDRWINNSNDDHNNGDDDHNDIIKRPSARGGPPAEQDGLPLRCGRNPGHQDDGDDDDTDPCVHPGARASSCVRCSSHWILGVLNRLCRYQYTGCSVSLIN